MLKTEVEHNHGLCSGYVVHVHVGTISHLLTELTEGFIIYWTPEKKHFLQWRNLVTKSLGGGG